MTQAEADAALVKQMETTLHAMRDRNIAERAAHAACRYTQARCDARIAQIDDALASTALATDEINNRSTT